MQAVSITEISFLLQGAVSTIWLSALGLMLGACAGLAIALMRTSGKPLLVRATKAYIAVFQGTPLLMQLFVTYYGLALMGLKLAAWESVAIGFMLHASAFLGEIWRGSIEAVPKGQTEAANALGISYFVRMRHIVLPQALRVSLPATVGFMVQLIKGTSLAAIVGFTELARSGSIVANQTFQPLITYAVVGAIYFAICWPLSLYGSRLEGRLSTAAR